MPKDDCANLLNAAFSRVFSAVGDCPHPEFQSPNFFPMFPISIDPAGIIKIIDSLKLSSSTGVDEGNSKFLESTKEYSSIILAKMFQQSLEESCLPDDWKVGRVVPLRKGGNKHSPKNFRLIFLTSVPCKIFEHVIYST